MKHTTLEELADQFDAFFIDQFGVLMDASGPYPFAVDTVKRLSEYGKPIVLISNSGKRAKKNCDRLERLGFELNLFTAVITSGEVAYWTLKNKFQDGRSKTPKIYLISRDADTSPINGLSCETTKNTNEADYLIIAGSESDTKPLKYYKSLLEPLATLLGIFEKKQYRPGERNGRRVLTRKERANQQTCDFVVWHRGSVLVGAVHELLEHVTALFRCFAFCLLLCPSGTDDFGEQVYHPFVRLVPSPMGRGRGVRK